MRIELGECRRGWITNGLIDLYQKLGLYPEQWGAVEGYRQRDKCVPQEDHPGCKVQHELQAATVQTARPVRGDELRVAKGWKDVARWPEDPALQ